MDAAVIAEKQETGGFARQAQGDFPGFSVSASGEGDGEDQSDPTRLGEILRDRPLESVFLVYPALGREEDSASLGSGVPASGLRLEAMEPGMAVRYAGTLFGVPRILRAVVLSSRSKLIGLINLDAKCAGARSAGNPHATCDAAGAGNQLTVRIVRHSQRKRGATDRPNLRSKGASPYSRSRNEIMDTNRGGVGRPLVRSVRRAFHRSKHLLEVLFERASRCYELPVLTHDVLVESFEQWDALGSRDEYSEAVCS